LVSTPSESASGCIFCSIIAGTAAAEVVWEDDVAVGFLDSRPLFVGHTLIVPRRHVVTITDFEPVEIGPFFERVQAVASVMPEATGCEGTFVANNNIVSQSVAHLHVHVVPRVRGDGLRGFFWPRTKYEDGEMMLIGERLRAAVTARFDNRSGSRGHP
jgi:histidine triad (HIT) family protein